jgi:phosphoribosylamine--glycine ligase
MAKNMAEHGHVLAVVGGREYMSGFFDTMIDAPPDDEKVIFSLVDEFKPDLIVPVSYETGYAGIVNKLRDKGYRVFGASKQGVLLEASKIVGLSVAVMNRVPVAPFVVVHDKEQVLEALQEDKRNRVVKRIGFAGGRGVRVLDTEEEVLEQALAVIEQDGVAMIQREIRGIPVNVVWIQTPSGPVQLCLQTDYKKTYSGDLGPFCGAMGAAVWNHVPTGVLKTIIAPMNDYLISIGYFGRVGLDCMYEYESGKLYAIEWTARFGVPTTETMLATWDDDFAELFVSWLDGSRNQPKLKGKVGIGVAIAGGGYPYPNAVKQGLPVTVKGELDNVIPMGVYGKLGELKTMGGRHFVAVGHGNTVAEARSNAYEAVKKVSFTDMFYRTDIGEDMLQNSVFDEIELGWK